MSDVLRDMDHLLKYSVEATKRTPHIILEPGRIVFEGRSITENPGETYRPVFDWITRFAQICREETQIEFAFEYINTSSTKWIYNIIKEIAQIRDIEKYARILWYYENGDDDMCELGHILRSLTECPFFIVETAGLRKNPVDPQLLDAV
jgi:hypothetical protein